MGTEIWRFGNFTLDTSRRMLMRDGAPLRVPPHSLEVLSVLVKNAPRVTSLEDLIRATGLEKHPSAKQAIYRTIAELRHALSDDSRQPRYITSLQNGYRFIDATAAWRSEVEPARTPELKAQARHLRVFLCHASSDKPAVRQLRQRLLADHFHPWLDEEDLLPGQDFALEIRKAIGVSDVVLICLSRTAVTKEGFIQKEIKYALDVADEKPEGTVFLIPLRLEECDVISRLRHLHWVDLFAEHGYDRLIRALAFRAQATRP